MFPSPGVIPAFKFQMRRDTIDWRRFSAIDVERVARELDLATLQENINSITFCNLDAEKCPYCQQPADPVLLKVFKMAQLTIEYLLHSQEYLSMNLTLQEEQHQAALEEIKRIRYDLDKQVEELKSVKEESRRRKKMIATQQLLLQAGANNYHKCQLCDKTFMNYSFLQAHMQRRHPEATAVEKEKKKQVEQMESEIEELKVKLKETQAQLGAESQFRAQEAENVRQREEEGRRKFEKWKEEERLKFQKEMEDLRNLLLTEFKDIATKNSALEEKVQELQAKNAPVSNLGTLQDEDSVDKQRWIKAQKELQAMKGKIEQQKTEWKWKLRELQKEHQMEKEELKGENERLRNSLSSDQWKMAEQNKQQMALFTTQLSEQAKIIQSQEKAIKILSSSKAKEMQKIPKTEKLKEAPREELEDTLSGKKRVLEALSRDPSLLKQFRPILEETLEGKLESMGVKRDAKGITAQTYQHLKEIIKKQQEQKAKTFPQFFILRKKLEQEVKNKVSWSQKDESEASLPYSIISNKYQRSLHSPIQVKSSTPKIRQIESHSYMSEVPKPAPRNIVSSLASSVESPRLPSPKQVRSNPPSPQHSAAYHPSTSPFSSEEESIEEQIFASPKLTPRKTKTEPPPTVQHEESEWDSSDIDMSEEKGSPGKDLSPASRTHSGTRVQSIAQNLERSLNVSGRKPTGGVKLFSVQSQEDPKPDHSAKKLQFVAEEESDLEISSLEEITQHLNTPKQQQTTRSSRDIAESRGSSSWGASNTRGGAW